ncbi:MAG: hypothetical protein AAFQ37_07075 [Bacteroidota bacterium]
MRNLVTALLMLGVISYLQRKNDNPPIYYLKSLPFGFNGLAIPPFGIFIKDDLKNNSELLLHELVHWKQFQREGLLLFVLNYSLSSINYGYDGNLYEVEARFNEDDFCKSNYTYCVRNGLAKTVYNPSFNP